MFELITTQKKVWKFSTFNQTRMPLPVQEKNIKNRKLLRKTIRIYKNLNMKIIYVRKYTLHIFYIISHSKRMVRTHLFNPLIL